MDPENQRSIIAGSGRLTPRGLDCHSTQRAFVLALWCTVDQSISHAGHGLAPAHSRLKVATNDHRGSP